VISGPNSAELILFSTERKVNIDHDHETQCVRGLLCTPCILLLGNATDDISRLSRAVLYLQAKGDFRSFIKEKVSVPTTTDQPWIPSTPPIIDHIYHNINNDSGSLELSTQPWIPSTQQLQTP